MFFPEKLCYNDLTTYKRVVKERQLSHDPDPDTEIAAQGLVKFYQKPSHLSTAYPVREAVFLFTLERRQE